MIDDVIGSMNESLDQFCNIEPLIRESIYKSILKSSIRFHQCSNFPRVRKFIASVVASAVNSTRYRGSSPTSPHSFIRSQVRQMESINPLTIGRLTPVQ